MRNYCIKRSNSQTVTFFSLLNKHFMSKRINSSINCLIFPSKNETNKKITYRNDKGQKRRKSTKPKSLKRYLLGSYFVLLYIFFYFLLLLFIYTLKKKKAWRKGIKKAFCWLPPKWGHEGDLHHQTTAYIQNNGGFFGS